MLRKLIMFAITSGLAKKAYDHYRRSRSVAPTGPVRHVSPRSNVKSLAAARPSRKATPDTAG